PGAVRGLDPVARLVEELAAAQVARVGILLVAVDGILEDGEHEEALTLEPARAAKRRKELGGQQDVRLEEASQPLVSRGKTALAFCNHHRLPSPPGVAHHAVAKERS